MVAPFPSFGGRALREHRRSSDSIPPLFREQEDDQARLPLPLQSAVEWVPREVPKREAACFLRPNFEGLNGTNDFDRHIALNSSN